MDPAKSMEYGTGAALAFAIGMTFDPARVEHLTRIIIACAIEVHRRLGPGLLESVYVRCLLIELRHRELAVEVGRHIPLYYRGIPVDSPFFLDIVVDDLVVVEVKSVVALAAVHSAQVVTYLRLGDFPAGLLLNFNVHVMRAGIRRLDHPHLYKNRARPLRMDDVSTDDAGTPGESATK